MHNLNANTKPGRTHRVGESGNALFLILIAVALFAFLSYTVSQSTRSNEGSGREENTSLRASEIMQYGTYMAQAVMRMTFRGVSADNLCFDADGWEHNDYYYSACDEPKNQIFSSLPDAGGVSLSKQPQGANDGSPWYIPANVCVVGVGVSVEDDCNSDGTGDSEDLVLVLPNISKTVCMEINKVLDIANPNGNPPKAGGNMFDSGQPYFTGSFADGGRIDSAGTDPSILRGHSFGCVEGNGTPPEGTYLYYHVLMAR
jgi:hypothetical protein